MGLNSSPSFCLSNLPWCIIKDFNDLLLEDNKIGPMEHPQRLLNRSREVVVDCHLIDIPLDGYPFTWYI